MALWVIIRQSVKTIVFPDITKTECRENNNEAH